MKVTIEVDLTNKEQVKAAIAFLNGTATAKTTSAGKEKEPAKEEEEDDLNGGGEEVTLAQLRELTAAKQGDHREKIKKWLTDNDCKNVTTMPEKLFPAYKAFLDKLK